MAKEISITTRKQLDIYMNPQRQRILKLMDIYAIPVTPKQLSVKLGISSSSVTHHLKKLEELGVVALDSTKKIHGIEAKYYVHLPVNINLGGDQHDDLQTERILLSDYLFNDVWKDFKMHLRQINKTTPPCDMGDSSSGIIYLNKEEVMELKSIIQDFYNKHMIPKPDTVPWETAVIGFPCNINDFSHWDEL